jgi:hypothetical protein
MQAVWQNWERSDEQIAEALPLQTFQLSKGRKDGKQREYVLLA